jgi:serine/threonine-protein kinase
MRRLWIVVALLAFGYTLLPAMPASAGYGAIAWDRDTGKYGASWNQPTPQRAEEAALGECGASGCKVVGKVGPRMCGALATTQDGKHAGAARRNDRETARLAAVKNCDKDRAGECIVRATDCNK